MIKIKVYENKYKNQVIALILYIQNFDNRVDLSLEEQPDMNDIENHYFKDDGCFWIAVNQDDDVVGTLGLMHKKGGYGVLKKFFVAKEYRGKEIGTASLLFDHLLCKAEETGIKAIVLDTPSACYGAHKFYDRHGFKRITKQELPIEYDYPDRDSYLFMLETQFI